MAGLPERKGEEPTDNRMAHATRVLLARVTEHCRGRDFSSRTIQEVEQIVKDHRTEARQRGIAFPTMAVLAMDKQLAIRLFRRNLEPKSIDRIIINLTREFPNADAAEIARAVKRAWPNHRCDPSTVIRQG